MPITKVITLYSYDELSDKAKERAREWYRSTVFSDSSDWENVYEYAEEVANKLGITFNQRKEGGPCIWFSGFSSQGDGACFDGTYRYAPGASKKFPDNEKLRQIAEELQEVQRRHFYKLVATCKQRGFYSHSAYMDVDVDELLAPLRKFADWIYKQLNEEYDYQSSDEAIEEMMHANPYTFTEEGKRES